MDVLHVRRVGLVLHQPHVVAFPAVAHGEGAPAGLPVLAAGHDGGPLRFRQVAEEHEHQSVALFHRVGVDAGTARDLLQRAQGGNAFAGAVAVELPAVVRALDAVADHLAVAERAAAVGAGVVGAAGAALAVAPEHELQAQHLHLQRLVGEVPALFRRVPEVDEHGVPPRPSQPSRSQICRGAKPSRRRKCSV